MNQLLHNLISKYNINDSKWDDNQYWEPVEKSYEIYNKFKDGKSIGNLAFDYNCSVLDIENHIRLVSSEMLKSW